VDAAVWYMQLDQFEPQQVFEQRLDAAMHETGKDQVSSPQPFLDALAAGTAAPGGGSASACSGAAGAALVAMVARLTIGKKKYATVEERMKSILEQAEALRASLSRAIQEDAAAFEAVMQAFKLPKDSPQEQEQRTQAIEAATLQAARVPLEVARQSVEVMQLASEVIAQGNLNAISDGASAAAQARAALTGAGYNVRINLLSLPGNTQGTSLLAELKNLQAQANAIEEQIHHQLQQRGGLTS